MDLGYTSELANKQESLALQSVYTPDSANLPATPQLTQFLSPFASITLAEMQNVALLDRVETKYVLHQQSLLPILSELQTHYRILSVSGERLSRYQTLYYDTPDFALYHSHHAGVLDRYKIRTREYVDSALTFLEVKHKTNKNRTVKYRLPIAQPPSLLAESAAADCSSFLQHNSPYSPHILQPVLWNRYRRITLVGKESAERITLDVDLSFDWQETQQALPNLVIAEVKQPGRQQSPFIQKMRMAHIHEVSFSKYCMGATLIYPTLKANRFKKKQRQIDKLLQFPLWSGRMH